MKLPKKIHLLDGEYTIKMVNDDKLVYRDKIDESINGRCAGRIYHKTKLILINKSRSYDEQLETLWHEIVHHFFYFFDMKSDEGISTAISKMILNIQEQLV